MGEIKWIVDQIVRGAEQNEAVVRSCGIIPSVVDIVNRKRGGARGGVEAEIGGRAVPRAGMGGQQLEQHLREQSADGLPPLNRNRDQWEEEGKNEEDMEVERSPGSISLGEGTSRRLREGERKRGEQGRGEEGVQGVDREGARPLGVGVNAGGGERQDQGPLGGGLAPRSGVGQDRGPQGELEASSRGGGQERIGQEQQGRRGHLQLSSEHAQKDKGEIRVGKGKGNKGKAKKKIF